MVLFKIPERFSGLLIGFLGNAILFKDLIFGGTYKVLWASDFDPALIYWVLEWGYHILFEKLNPGNFWNANSFYPNILTLAYSESLLSMQIFYTPLRALGLPSMVALYATLGATGVISCILTKFALDRIGLFSALENILITFSSHFILSVTSFLLHYQLFGFQLATPFFLFLYLYLRDFRTSDLVATCSLFAIGVCYSTYLAPILVTFAFFLSAPQLIQHVWISGFRSTVRKIGTKGLGTVIIYAVILFFVLVKPYIFVAGLFPKQSSLETATYSANISSLFNGFSAYSYWYAPSGYGWGDWERAYFPGYTLLAAGLAFVLYPLYAALKSLDTNLSGPENNLKPSIIGKGFISQYSDPGIGLAPSFILYISILFALSIVLSWGPHLRWNGQILTLKLPFYWFAHIFPGLDSIRAPGRLGMFIGLPLSIFLVFFVRKLFSYRPLQTIITTLLLIIIIIESLPAFETYPFSPDPDGTYAQVARHEISNQPLLELPVANVEGHIETILQIMEQLDGSTIHWAKLVVGYAPQQSEELSKLTLLDHQLQNNQIDINPIINFARENQIFYYLIHLNRYPPEISKNWEQFAAREDVRVIWRDKNSIFLEFPTPTSKSISNDTRP